jgi:hypothetical protein
VSHFVWDLTLDLSGLGDPASSYATAGLALGFIGTRMPHHHDQVETPLVGNSVFRSRFINNKAFFHSKRSSENVFLPY